MANERDMVTQSSFSRSLANDAKAGAYYTDLEMCKSISGFFSFPEKESVCALEPSIGDGAAIKTVMSGAADPKIFGVELRTEVAKKTGQDIEICLDADFLTGVKISHKVFSFCFSNPPYGEDGAKHERYEKMFLEKLSEYLKPRARLVYVIPQYVLVEEAFLRFLLSRYEINYCYKFREPEFSRFKQVVVIATRKANVGYLKDVFEEWKKRVTELEELPEVWEGEKLEVLSSDTSQIQMFTKMRFDPNDCKYLLSQTAFTKAFGESLKKKPYDSSIKQPVIPLSNDMYYLLAISGAGQGIAGSVKEGDIHLQRGCVKRVKATEVTAGKDGGKEEMVERTYSAISLTILEQSGKVTKFGDTVKGSGGDK